MAAPPTGTVTLLFTDVEGSTRLWETSPAAMEAATDRHDELCRAAVAAFGGHQPVSQGEGDSLVAAFASAVDAVRCAAALQARLHAEPWPEGARIRVRMAVHTGAVGLKEGDYFGIPMNRCARLRALASGGQVLLSFATARLVEEAPAGAGAGAAIELRDLGVHRLRDLTQPEHVFELRWPGAPAVFPPLKSLDAQAHNLPVQLTTFVGRGREAGETADLVVANRLVTLTGAGGSGKTRLALQVAADLLDKFGDGAWLVELAPLADGALVAAQVAAALTIAEEPGRDILASVVDWLRPRSLLLVVDNCEHVVGDAARVVDAIVRSTANVHVLATGREALGVAGEVPYRVPSLAVPAEDDDPADSDAVQLFVDRAATLGALPAPDQSALAAIGRICRRLDGIPLAIELAAARTRVLSPEQIAERLGDRFRLLTGGSRTALPRQQTLRATVDWSYDLLSAEEQSVMRRLAAFSGGFTLDAAEVVAAAGGADVLDVVTSLVDKSLVEVVRRDPSPRYRLLETVREYGAEKLVGAGDADDARFEHLRWCLGAASEAAAALDAGGGSDTESRLLSLEDDHDNFRAALEWATAAHRPHDALELATALYSFWWMRGHVAEGSAWYVTLLAAAEREGEVSPSLRARALRAGSLFALFRGDREQAASMAEDALVVAREVGDVDLVCSALRMLANHREFDDEGLAHLEDAVALAEREGHRSALVFAERSLGYGLGLRGDLARASSLLDSALAAAVDETARAWVLEAAGWVAFWREDRDGARRFFGDAVEAAARVGSAWPAAAARAGLASVARVDGAFDDARALAESALAGLRSVGDEQRASLVLVELAAIAADAGDVPAAERWLDQASRPRRLTWRRVQEGVASVRSVLGLIAGQ